MQTKNVLSKLTPEKIETKTLNSQIMVEEKASCIDQKPKKVCKKLKAKNNGKGCNKESTKKKCKKTCGLCDDSMFSQSDIIECLTHFMESFFKNPHNKYQFLQAKAISQAILLIWSWESKFIFT